MSVISENDKKYLLSLKPDDLTFDCLVNLFGTRLNMEQSKGDVFNNQTKPRFQTNDELTLNPADYFVKTKTDTTVGRFIYNKYIVEKLNLQDITGYINWVLTDGGNGKIEAILSEALMNDKINVSTYFSYIDRRDNLGMQLNSVITTSYTMKTLKTSPKVKKHRDQLFKQYDKELNDGDIRVSEMIEKILMKEAREEMKDDPGIDLYDSAARGNFGNYKNCNLFKGATFNNVTGKYDIVRSSFMDGIKKEDIPSFGNSVVAGAYPKAVGTQVSGYLAKQLIAALQTEVLDEPDSDCGTHKTIEVELTAKNFKDFEYRYIVVGNNLVELNQDNKAQYIGKTVHMRSPMMCVGDKICNKCAGNLYYKLGVSNIGLTASRVATTLTRLNMKKFHISNLKSSQIDVDHMLL